MKAKVVKTLPSSAIIWGTGRLERHRRTGGEASTRAEALGATAHAYCDLQAHPSLEDRLPAKMEEIPL